MAETILGVDFGYDSLKLALVNGKQVKKSAIVPMPKNLIKEGRVVSAETMGELLRKTAKSSGIACKSAALALPNEIVFVKSVSAPQMIHDQLLYNLPYEFRDYITDELKNYIYDYAIINNSVKSNEAPAPGTPEEESGEAKEYMELLAAAVPTAAIEEDKLSFRKAGMKLVSASPAVSSYISLIRNMEPEFRPQTDEYCIIDLGYKEIRMFLFKGDVNVTSRTLEVGLSVIDDVIAENYNVDIHLAHTYLLSNYDDCQNKDACVNSFNNIAVELMRAMNFYRFSNPDSRLADIWICGGGAVIPALKNAIKDTLDLNIHEATELVKGGENVENCNALLLAIGAAMNKSGR